MRLLKTSTGRALNPLSSAAQESAPAPFP